YGVMFDDILEKDKFPRITFQSLSVAAPTAPSSMHRIDGDLTIHGVTKRIVIDVQILAGTDSLRAQGKFSIRKSDFGLKTVSVAGGAIKLKDELKGSFFIVGDRV